MYQDKDLSAFTHDELSKAMRQLNLNVGPITSSTRKIYENRLRSHLKQQSRKELPEQFCTENDIKQDVDFKNQKHIPDGIINKTDGGNNNESMKTCKPVLTVKINADEAVINDNNDDGPFYGVWIPFSPTKVNDNKKLPNVFRSKEDALKKAKEHKGSRFKSFSTRNDAEGFSLNLTPIFSVDKMCELIINGINAVNNEPQKTFIKGPIFQELMKFRRAIEEDDIQFVQQCLSNPKYLISSTDLPVILQEGTRLNALHIAVKYNKLNMCDHIMNTIRSDEFLSLMYPNSTNEVIQFRKSHLVDLYLNTPDKILCETPLHLASKFGFAPIVEFLLSLKQLNVGAKNKDGKSSNQIICSRVNLKGRSKQELIERIENLFEEKAYIPLYENVDSCSKVGQPIMTLSKERIELAHIKAIAGPMSPDKASLLYQSWKKSPRSQIYSQIARTDYEKGMERIGRVLARKECVPFSEYWKFLSSYVDFSTPEGLQKLETYLRFKMEHLLNKKIEKRKTLSSSSNHIQSRLTTSADEVKRKLTFDINEEKDSPDKLTLNSKVPNGTDIHNSKSDAKLEKDEKILSRKVSRTLSGECYCSCGKLLEYCDKCTVNINTAEQTVAFSMCSPPQRTFSPPPENIFSPRQNTKLDTSKYNNDVETVPTLLSAEENDTYLGLNVFIDGGEPSKHDLDVLRALNNVIVNADRYPCIERWKELVESFPDHTKTSWPSPSSPRYPLKRNILWTA